MSTEWDTDPKRIKTKFQRSKLLCHRYQVNMLDAPDAETLIRYIIFMFLGTQRLENQSHKLGISAQNAELRYITKILEK